MDGQIVKGKCYPKIYFESVRVQLETMLLEKTDNPRVLSALGVVYGGLGEKGKAIKEYISELLKEKGFEGEISIVRVYLGLAEKLS